MHVVILADEVGSKLWPVSSEKVPKALMPVYSELSQLEETLERFSPLVDGVGSHFIIVTLDQAMESLISQKTLTMYGIPKTNVLSLPSCKGSAWAMWEAVRYLLDLKEVPSDEPVFFSPADQFLWPKELAMFHLLNAMSRTLTNPEECITVALTPGGPSPGMNYFYGDWQKVGTISVPYEDAVLGTVSTLGVAIEGFQVMPDMETAKDLVANNWMWDLNTYCGRLEMFDHYLRGALQAKVSQIMRWESLETVSFSFVVPSIVTDQKMFAALIPKIAWSTLDNWVSIRHLLYDSGLFQGVKQTNVHSIESAGNLVFKPPDKTVALYGVHGLVIVDTGDKLLIGTPEGLHEFF